MTVVETILQIIKNIPHSRILVATPSNSAANLITERIVESGVVEKGEFMRLVSHNNITRSTIPTSIISHCGTIEIARDGTTKDSYKLTESGLQLNCSASHLKKHRMLIGT